MKSQMSLIPQKTLMSFSENLVGVLGETGKLEPNETIYKVLPVFEVRH